MSRLELATIGSFALGAGLLFPFESTFTILFGVLLLGASIVCGVFVLADPRALAVDPEEDSPPA